MLKFSVSLLLICSIAYIGICLLLYLMQRRMMYFPTPPTDSDLAEVIWLSSANEKVKVWHVSRNSERAIIYFGGNAEDVALNIPSFINIFHDQSLYLLNYRGYGGSSGRPTEQGLFTDAQTLFDTIQKRHSHITVIGRSLGTGVAICLAGSRNVQSLILITPYDSMAEVASNHYPFFPVSLLLKDKYDSLGWVKNITAKTLILIAEYDEIIPRRRSVRLAEAFRPGQVQVEVLNRTDHNTISASPRFGAVLNSFASRQ
ncbi:alpha/beta hydrolase [Desulfopila aestuarii]|uniref:AB hydrolase-1 domain-containing protein n=1 Tax=Desulfopila aestuarii DSM 18488 TaxID=1121416 RepID=A0A1M7YMH0_9BACT|nr:alpha/beta fold hydrolase [Desulfopila aestuarii]SHO53772.1 hypothetical protein SAMN02745220_05301 [Desulfopila aestuarii DSM 18488]